MNGRLLTALIATALLVALFAAGWSTDDDGDSGARAPAAASDQASGEESAAPADAGQAVSQQVEASIVFTSPVFHEKRRIPKKHTCTQISANVPNISPPLGWEGLPDGTVSLALIMDSLEIEGAERVHWVMWNMPPTLTGLEENVGHAEKLADGTAQGANGSGEVGYLGPCPPVIGLRVRGDAVEDPDAGWGEEGHREVLLQALRAGHDARPAVIDDQGGSAEGHRRPRPRVGRAGGRTPGPSVPARALDPGRARSYVDGERP